MKLPYVMVITVTLVFTHLMSIDLSYRITFSLCSTKPIGIKEKTKLTPKCLFLFKIQVCLHMLKVFVIS